jgi:hypothetical protein
MLRRSVLSRRLIARSFCIALAGAGAAHAQVAAQPARARFDGHAIVSVDVSTAKNLQAVLALTDDVWTHDYPTAPQHARGRLDVRLSPGALAALGELGIAHEVLLPDVQALIDAEAARLGAGNNVAAGWYDDFKTYDEINAHLEALAAARPDLAHTEVIGKTLQGRDIHAIRITGPGSPEDRPAFLIDGCQHAREWITPMMVMYTAEQLLAKYDADPRVRTVVDAMEFLIVPVVNPDGYVYTWTTNRLWRKNRRDNGGGSFGVDLNRNWGYQWGGEGSSGDPDDETYRGVAPMSEPETLVISSYAIANPRIALSIDFHSYGQLILSPWGYTIDLPPDAGLFDQLNALLKGSIEGVHDLTYAAGPTYTTIYPAAGVIADWMYGDQGFLAWGIELRPQDAGGGGFILPPDQIIPTVEENFEGVLELALDRTRPIRINLVEPLPSLIEPGESLVFDATIEPGTDQVEPGSGMLNWRVGEGAFAAAALEDLGGGLFRATVPPAPCGEVVQVYLSAESAAGDVVTYPAAGPDEPLAVDVLASVIAYDDPAEVNLGWAAGDPGDDADTGMWQLGNPQGTAAQPEDDHTPAGSMCWITGAARNGGDGGNDIDGGTTTLTSPAMDATGGEFAGGEARISYWRWYSNDQGNSPDEDSMPVLISGDDGQSWIELELVEENAGLWVYREFVVADFVEPSATVRLRFVARDLGDGSLVEAGVDDIQLMITGCPEDGCYPDLDGNGALDLFDFLEFVNLFNGGDDVADCTGEGTFDLFDFLCFVNAFNQGC